MKNISQNVGFEVDWLKSQKNQIICQEKYLKKFSKHSDIYKKFYGVRGQ